jgi:hypothetical protein
MLYSWDTKHSVVIAQSYILSPARAFPANKVYFVPSVWRLRCAKGEKGPGSKRIKAVMTPIIKLEPIVLERVFQAKLLLPWLLSKRIFSMSVACQPICKNIHHKFVF